MKRAHEGVPRGPAGDRLLEATPHRLDHLLLVGELAGLELGVEQLAVDGDLEAAAAGRDELEVVDLLLVSVQQLGRQTDGLWLVVSHRTVLDLDVHGKPPWKETESPAGVAGDRLPTIIVGKTGPQNQGGGAMTSGGGANGAYLSTHYHRSRFA